MFQRIQQYPLMTVGTHVYRPRAYADPQPDGTWNGWLVFFPLDGSEAIASDRETTQSSFDALVTWAARITTVYLEGALQRALDIAYRPAVLADLAQAEYEALEDAERLQAASEIERAIAEADADAARSAEETAREIHRARLPAEDVRAGVDERAADHRRKPSGQKPRSKRPRA